MSSTDVFLRFSAKHFFLCISLKAACYFISFIKLIYHLAGIITYLWLIVKTNGTVLFNFYYFLNSSNILTSVFCFKIKNTHKQNKSTNRCYSKISLGRFGDSISSWICVNSNTNYGFNQGKNKNEPGFNLFITKKQQKSFHIHKTRIKCYLRRREDL